ncbi:hypothetical protein [Verrucomicrobium sp. BvORR034]|uniref:hypothetical protein n=1 Tax=Verrucomicrobium sp. BvORR034 TaxID=1396418 RepID=UPI00067898B0|nr:hypothetical protein [Verrucomicrobium sp. BvORR034]
MNEQLRAGYVSKEAFQRLFDAECYGNVSSMCVLKSWLGDLDKPLSAGKRIEIEGDRFISSLPELHAWIKEKLPEAYACFYEHEQS